MALYLSLIHHPVVDRNGDRITSSVTNLDLHDIARSCRTYGVKNYFVVHPSPDEHALNRRIVNHWKTEYGKDTHPTRTDAVQLIQLVSDFQEVLGFIENLEGKKPQVVGTSAKDRGAKSLKEADVRVQAANSPVLLVFGTGYGLAPDWDGEIDGFLGPLKGPGDYNHLSVRSAVAIYLDRINGLKT